MLAARKCCLRRMSSQPSKPLPVDKAMTKVTLSHIQKLRRTGVPIAMITATDYSTARMCERPYPLPLSPDQQPGTDVAPDIVLVGDSLAMVALGHESTVPVTLQNMSHHSSAVARGCQRPLIVTDMPYGSTGVSRSQSVRNALMLVQYGGVDAVKVEGTPTIRGESVVNSIVQAGIPVMAHVGLTPQSFTLQSGYKAQGTTAGKAYEIFRDALKLQEDGAFAIVLECVPHRVAQVITDALDIPTIGIGAGSSISAKYNSGGCVSGQVLVMHDLLGIHGYDPAQMPDLTRTDGVATTSKVDERLKSTAPKFCKQYASIGQLMHRAVAQYVYDVRTAAFPTNGKNTFRIDDDEFDKFREMVAKHRQQ